ncbi:Membrane-associated guanylate kinase, WW and PDZ domain-containing protein 2 [Fukomys damarensis]|uniref:Membrane-associated guanylate kinase, WW and PDZ domain-containing protein 2 n=1 Tax=Fukomys damarensis TaxID=885580 RepID=A0A091E4R0_FUKDA|nr:Membrane-associated guanylate kinase, WW and PDZ domain-containing protein 2 [Fukomys damarensis]
MVMTVMGTGLRQLVKVPANSEVKIDNYYGTPKPPAEPAPLLLNVTDQILPGATPSAEGKRKRNKSVSNMEKASIEPPEEEEEERPVVNGNGVVVTPGRSCMVSRAPPFAVSDVNVYPHVSCVGAHVHRVWSSGINTLQLSSERKMVMQVKRT